MYTAGSANVTEYYLLKKAFHGQQNTPESTNMNRKGLKHLDPDTNFRIRQISSRVSDTVCLAANEPSLGLYRIQEHVSRTMPHLVRRKGELRSSREKITDAVYDLNTSIDVIGSIAQIKNFTRISVALQTSIEMKRSLMMREEQEKARRELELKQASYANRSMSLNEPAEGYICPICYFALTSQEELISHWQKEHTLESVDNDVFHEITMPSELNMDGQDTNISNMQDNAQRVTMDTRVSECEDVVNSFHEITINVSETNENSASEGSDEFKS